MAGAAILHRILILAICVAAVGMSAPLVRAAERPAGVLKTQTFDQDPRWEELNNRVIPASAPTVRQDFGYSATHFAGRDAGEIGGLITRCNTPAYYGQKLKTKTLNDKLTASGTFALTSASPGFGLFFGWFSAQQESGVGRPVGSLGLQLGGERGGGRLAVRLIGATNKSCGTFITPYGKNNRPLPIKADGTRYHWTLAYDPAAAEHGQFCFTIKSDSDKPEDFEGKEFKVDVPGDLRSDGASFDHFGLMNLMKSGGESTIYFDDLEVDGKREGCDGDPEWEGSGNRISFKDTQRVGAHDFGYSPKTNWAGGAPGEVGGDLWRSGKYAYYADAVGPLSLEDRLEASGRVILKVGAPDSDMFLGWFSSENKERPPVHAGNFLGVHVGGPTRVGHYFHPALTPAGATRLRTGPERGPVLVPGKSFSWSLIYDPTAEGGQGAIRVTLGDESVTLALKPGEKVRGARFDRFGLFTSDIGGQLVRIYFDDLKYTASRSAP